MKSLCYAAVAALAAGSANAAPRPQLELVGAFASGKIGEFLGSDRGTASLTNLAKVMGASKSSAGSLGVFVKDFMNYKYGKVAPGAKDAPVRDVFPQSRSRAAGAKTIKIRYGPYKVPNMMNKNMVGEKGSLFNLPDANVEKPCKGDCNLVGITTGLEYPDGKSANIDTGMWLHHMLIFTVGKGRKDATCGDRDISLPSVLVGATSQNSERLLASGNERTPILWPAEEIKAGYKLRADDQLSLVVDLMNDNMDDRTVYVTVTYDVVDGIKPEWDEVRVVWLDVNQCGTSERSWPKDKKAFSWKYSWTSNFDGDILGAGGHLHDGGTHLTIAADDRLVCDSEATYGASPAYVGKEMHAGSAKEHISNMTFCYPGKLGVDKLRTGQRWSIEAFYDLEKRKAVLHDDGTPDKVMGIALMYVRVKSKA